MKALALVFVMVLALAIANEAVSQQVVELKPPSQETLAGVIKKVDAKGNLVVSMQAAADTIQEASLILNDETTITLDGKVARASDLRAGQMVTVEYTAENSVAIVNNVPTGEVVLRTAKMVSAVSASGKTVACDKPSFQIDYFEVNVQGERLSQFRVEVGTKPVGGASSLKAVVCWSCDPTSSKCTHTAVLEGERKTDAFFMSSFTGWVVFADEQTKKQHGGWTINNKMIRADGSELILKEGDRIPFQQ